MVRRKRRKRGSALVSAALLASALLALGPTAASAQRISAEPPSPRAVPGELVVRYAPGTGAGERAALRREQDAGLERRLLLPRAELLRVEPGTVKRAAAALERRPDVLYASPNFVYELQAPPSDPFFASNQLWGLNNVGGIVNGTPGVADADIDAPEAWDEQPGDGSAVIGVVDSGIAYDHPDLINNIWENPGESGALATDGIDNDGNGLEDDHRGWDWVGPGSGDNDPYDENSGHGTHVAGTIAAEGDNSLGVTGVSWDAQLMPLRVCGLISCDSAAVADAFSYAGAEGADVVNASISGTGLNPLVEDAVQAAPGTLFVVAAGNDNSDNDASPRYPCNIGAPNVVCVAASNQSDQRAAFSNYGGGSVDLAAPGTNALSTYPFTNVWLEDFEDPFGGWAFTGTWARTTEAAASPTHSLSDSPGGNYTDNSNTHAVTTVPIDLSGKTGCQLRYALLIDTQANSDFLRVEASKDGADGPFTLLSSKTGDANATFTDILPPDFNGAATVHLRFRLETDTAIVHDGAYIDDVRIRCLAPPDYTYAFLSGTSMASPHVAGAAAILVSENPAATVSELRAWLLDGVDPKPSFGGVVASGGRLNLRRSLDGAQGDDIHRPETSIGATSFLSPPGITFSFSADEPSSFQCRLDSGPFGPCASPHTYSGLAAGQHSVSVFATDASGNADLTPATTTFSFQPPAAVSPAPTRTSGKCKKLRKKLKRARSKKAPLKLRKAKPKLRKKIKRYC